VNHKITAVNGVKQAIARRLDAAQYPQDKERGEQAYQMPNGSQKRSCWCQVSASGLSVAQATTVKPSSGTGFITYIEPLYCMLVTPLLNHVTDMRIERAAAGKNAMRCASYQGGINRYLAERDHIHQRGGIDQTR
jgi:hypothetical protein